MPLWQRLTVLGVVLLLTVVAARLIDRRIARRDLPPEAITRYRVLRRSITTTIFFVGLLSALLVIPQVRAVAGGLLASSAVVGIVVGFASQRTLGNFVAGLLIAFTQPLRLGDEVEIDGTRGVVEEIGLIYTFVRTDNDDRLVIPNETLASDTILNSTIRSREKVAEVTVQVPLSTDLGAVVDRLRRTTNAEVFVRDLAGQATVVVRARAASERAAEELARDLRLRGSIPAENTRQPVARNQISNWVPKATVAIEDKRFYEHGALDWLGVVRALYRNVQAGKVVQGGSTITQQLVRNLYIKKKSQTFGRKMKEACLAIKLARHHSKAWILTKYMNQVYYGNHAYGIEAAAQTYFSKPASKLTLRQSALLAGLPQAPSLFDPFHTPLEALARRDAVLRAMLGQGYITEGQYTNAIADRNFHLKAGKLYTS